MSCGSNLDSGWSAVDEVDHFETGQSRSYTLDGHEVLLCRTSKGFFAVSAYCTHARFSLEGGNISGCHLSCPEHGARFNLATGQGSGVARSPLRCFPTEIEEGQIFVQIGPHSNQD